MMKMALTSLIYIPVTHLHEIIRFNSHSQYHTDYGHDERPLNNQLHHQTTEGDALYRPTYSSNKKKKTHHKNDMEWMTSIKHPSKECSA